MFIPEKISELENEKKRTDKKFTVSQILRFIPLTSPAYKDIKEGKSVPKVSILERIAIFYGVDMNYFFSNMQSVRIEKELNVSDDDRDYFLNIIQNQAKKIGKLEEELKRNSIELPSYTMQDVPDLKVAEPEPKLKKVDQTQTKTN